MLAGQLHVAPPHLPAAVARLSGPARPLVVYQNCERIWWELERDGREQSRPVMDPRKAEREIARTDLNRGQRQAAHMILTSRNRVAGIQGSAGVGKSHLIRTTAGIAERNGYQVVVLAPYANQVERLQSDGLNASTLATFLVSKDRNIDKRTLVDWRQKATGFPALPGVAFRMAFPTRERRECGSLSEEPLPPDLRVAGVILVPR